MKNWQLFIYRKKDTASWSGITAADRGRCTQGPCLVFVEVKYRTDGRMGGPLEAVDKRKQRRIRQAAAHYMYSHGFAEDCACRFDVVGILGERVELVQDAF